MHPPPTLPNYIVYNSDGASRAPPDVDRVGSLGACLRVNDQILARFACYLGNVTNNIAEYEGALACLEHALGISHGYFCFRLDSMLVVKQLSGQWACRSLDLQPLYERGLTLLQALRDRPNVINVVVAHVYRDFNAEADALANRGIDEFSYIRHRNRQVVNDNWSPFSLTGARFVDAEGDVIMT
jgi:ribonuclease HI